MRQTIKIKIYLVETKNLKFICYLHKRLFLGKLLKSFADFPRVAYKKKYVYSSKLEMSMRHLLEHNTNYRIICYISMTCKGHP